MSENCAKFYIGQIALILKYLHEKKIVYRWAASNFIASFSEVNDNRIIVLLRDLKPENLLIDHCGYLKLCDFGFSAVVDSNNFDSDGTLNDFCGTAMYVAPEIVGSATQHKHSTPVDWWSLGVVSFEMIAGKAPFGDSENMSKFEIFNNINGKSVSFPLSSTADAKSLIGGLLIKDPLQRYTWKDIKSSPWFADVRIGRCFTNGTLLPILFTNAHALYSLYT
jgi:serine/threonine protein kinase